MYSSLKNSLEYEVTTKGNVFYFLFFKSTLVLLFDAFHPISVRGNLELWRSSPKLTIVWGDRKKSIGMHVKIELVFLEAVLVKCASTLHKIV